MNPSEEDTMQEENKGAATANETVEPAAGQAPDSPANEADVSAELTQLQADLAAAQAKADENWERSLRLQAEMDNQRRRFEKQVEDAHKYSVQKFVEGILPVIDSLEMGMQVDGDLESIREGMNLTLKQFESVMERFKIEAVDPVGQPFNPELHQAMAMQPSPDHDNNTVIAVMQKGYTLSGRTVRPAMVMVCKK